MKKESIVLALLTTTTAGIAVLSSTLPDVRAESATASVQVSSACTMSSYVSDEHSISLTVGSSEEGIGTTELTTICNDPSGYAIYAVGYTNDTIGNTNLTGINSGINIQTGTSSGDVSNWSMRVAKDTSSYNYSNIVLENGYDSYKVVPNQLIKVASFPTNTDTSVGSTITTSYAVNISTTQAADTYAGQVKYIMVHPSMASAPFVGLYMQEVDSGLFEGLNEGDTLNMKDSRTNEDYTVTVINLNNTKTLWMNENLKLPAGTTLTSADSNVSSDFTLSEDAWTSSSQDYYCKQNMHKFGGEYYYNWYAATANPSDDADDPTNENCANVSRDAMSLGDICPAGWRLLTGDEISSISLNIGTLSTSTGTGTYFSGNRYDVPLYSFFWASTRYNNMQSHGYYSCPGCNNGAGGIGSWMSAKRNGRSVRCIKTE